MKTIVLLFVAVLASFAFAARENFTVPSASFTAEMSQSIITVATGKDLLVYRDASNPDNTQLAVLRRNSAGVYERVLNTTRYSSGVATNGRWVTLDSEGIEAFRVDQNNNVTDSSYIYSDRGFLLSDDTFVGYLPNDDWSGAMILTYKFNSTEDQQWPMIPGTQLNVSTIPNYNGQDFSSYRVTDSHLVNAVFTPEDYSVDIYERNADKSWKYIESVPVNSTYAAGVTYNGINTLVYAITSRMQDRKRMVSESLQSIVWIYTKISGVWTEQTFTATSLGYDAESNFGSTVKFIDADTLLITAPSEGDVGAFNAGKVLVFYRNETTGLWEPTFELVAEAGNFASGLGINDHDIIIPSVVNFNEREHEIVNWHIMPVCSLQKIDVTCHDQELNTCTDFSSIDVSSMEIYTINNECGQVTANVTRVNVVSDNKIEAQLTFSRDIGQSASCQVTVTCTNAPRSQTNTPAAASNAAVIQLGLVSLFGLASLLF